MGSPSLRQAKRSDDKSVASILKIHTEVDYERQYVGKTTTIDRSIGIFSGEKVTRSDNKTVFYPPKIVLVANPVKRFERVIKIAPFELQTSDEVTLAEYTDIEHESKAIVIADNKDDPLMKREEVDDTYTYAYGLGRVTTTGFRYVQDTDKLIHKVRASAEELGVADQLDAWVDEAVGIRSKPNLHANASLHSKLAQTPTRKKIK